MLALDLPSGLDGDSGEASDPTIRATETLTLALPKRGLLAPVARPWVGQLHLADISVPEKVYEHLGLKVGPIFAESDIIPIDLP
jgi:NAD(P)H-hydrate epimerase